MAMRRMSALAAAACLLLAFAGGAAHAQAHPAGTGTSATGGGAAPMAQPGTGTRNTETRKDDSVSRGDRKFIQHTAEKGMFEVQAAQLAAGKATDPNVKSFASMLVDHHTAANNELVQIANDRRIELSPAPPRGMRRDIAKLGKKSGADFDREFVREVGIKDHEKAIKDFEKASRDVKDPQLKAWVDKTLPKLREHLAQAQKLPQSGKPGAAMGNRGS
jgi:putative membrane protein